MSLNPFLPAPVTPPVTDSFTLGTVTQVSPLRVQRDGDTAPTDATPINTFGPLIVGDRVWCQLHGKALLVVGSVTAPARDLYMDNARTLLAGGGLRTGTSTGVSWSNRFQVSGAGKHDLAPDGYFNIYKPADGTVIPVYGSDTGATATVSGGVVPILTWQTLWYELPIGQPAGTVGKFYLTYYATPATVPSTWVPIVWRNGDSSAYRWGDGAETAIWTYPTLGNGWSNYGSGFASAAYKRENGIVYLEGLIKGGTVGSSATIFQLPVGYRPSGTLLFIGHASGGLSDVRVYSNGAVVVYAFIAGGTNADASLSGVHFPAEL